MQWVLTIIMLSALVVACGGDEESAATPTPDARGDDVAKFVTKNFAGTSWHGFIESFVIEDNGIVVIASNPNSDQAMNICQAAQSMILGGWADHLNLDDSVTVRNQSGDRLASC